MPTPNSKAHIMSHELIDTEIFYAVALSVLVYKLYTVTDTYIHSFCNKHEYIETITRQQKGTLAYKKEEITCSTNNS